MIDIQSTNMDSYYKNESYVQYRTQQLCSKTEQLKHLSIKIGDEIRDQNSDLPV